LARRLREEHGFRFVTPQEAADILEEKGSTLPGEDESPCLLTFDDGFRSNYFLAREVLEPLGLRAVFFVCPGIIELDAEARRSAVAANIRLDPSSSGDAGLEHELMAWEELRNLAALGHEIGSHGLTHRRLSETAPSESESEVVEAAKMIEERVGVTPRWFAFPFGNAASINAAALDRVASCHRFCRSGVRGVNAPGAPVLGLLSETLDPLDPVDYQLSVATGALDFRYRAARKDLFAKLAARDAARKR
jgi:peptidoglycan/xylan/chitin deacetylase (PgdA/CDA1 family)